MRLFFFLFVALLCVSCGKNEQLIITKKGKHVATPLRFNPVVNPFGKTYTWEVSFDEKSKYDLNNTVEQRDWSKLLGIAFGWRSKENSIMVGWRYIAITDQFEIGTYYHDATGEAFYPEKDATLQIHSVNETVRVSMEVREDMVIVRYKIDDETFIVENVPQVTPTYVGREINSWFGGTLPAPSQVEYKKTKPLATLP